VTAQRERIGQPVDALDTPVLLVDAALLERNIEAMRALVLAAPGRNSHAAVAYRPHTKSHKSPLIAKMQIAAGARGVCCAKLGEAEVMVAGGVPDIHITTAVVGRSKAERLMRLAAAARVSVVVDDTENVAALAAAATAAGITLDVLVEVDVGQARCGVQGVEQALAVTDAIGRSRALRFRGLQGYQGRLQSIVELAARRTAVTEAMDKLTRVRDALESRGIACEVLTGGGTGSLPLDLEQGVLNELQPGSYVFMDSTYRQIDWTARAERTPFANALTVLACVVSRPLAERAVLDVGWKAASSDSGPPVLKSSGAAIEFAGDEHGIIHGAAAVARQVGAKVELIPSHCDTTVNLHDAFHLVRNGVLEDVWPIAARGRSD